MTAPLQERPVAFDRERLLARDFPVESRRWDADWSVATARGLGAGLGGELAGADQRFLDPAQPWALPMLAVPLCDGEFWQQQPDTGIDWRRIVHAEEALTLHRTLPISGSARLVQRITDLRDRGAGRGAAMRQRLSLLGDDGLPLADVDVGTVLLGNGGFGGPPPDPAARPAPLPERAPDASVLLRTPSAETTRFCLSADLAVAAGLAMRADQRMLRGVGSFGLAGRAALAVLVDNDPVRLRHFAVRYAGPMLSDETVRLDLWRLADEEGEGRAVLRLWAVERDVAVLGHGRVAWTCPR